MESVRNTSLLISDGFKSKKITDFRSGIYRQFLDDSVISKHFKAKEKLVGRKLLWDRKLIWIIIDRELHSLNLANLTYSGSG